MSSDNDKESEKFKIDEMEGKFVIMSPTAASRAYGFLDRKDTLEEAVSEAEKHIKEYPNQFIYREVVFVHL